MIQESLDKIGDVDRLGLPLGASLSLLRQMTLDEFGELLLTIPNPSFPHLSKEFFQPAHPTKCSRYGPALRG